jgi:hypothetical protein
MDYDYLVINWLHIRSLLAIYPFISFPAAGYMTYTQYYSNGIHMNQHSELKSFLNIELLDPTLNMRPFAKWKPFCFTSSSISPRTPCTVFENVLKNTRNTFVIIHRILFD